MINISVEPVNTQEILRTVSHIPGAVEKATRRAITRTLKGARRDAGTFTKRRYTLPPSITSSSLLIKVSGMSGFMRSKGRRNPLEKAKVTPKSSNSRSSIRAIVVRGQGGVIRRAFRKKFNPHEGIFVRLTDSRFPIKKLTTVSAPGMVSHPTVANPIQNKIEQRISIELLHETSAILNGFS